MRYYAVKNRLVASESPIPSGEEISQEEYTVKAREMYIAAVEYAKNNPPSTEENQTTEEKYNALVEALTEVYTDAN